MAISVPGESTTTCRRGYQDAGHSKFPYKTNSLNAVRSTVGLREWQFFSQSLETSPMAQLLRYPSVSWDRLGTPRAAASELSPRSPVAGPFPHRGFKTNAPRTQPPSFSNLPRCGCSWSPRSLPAPHRRHRSSLPPRPRPPAAGRENRVGPSIRLPASPSSLARPRWPVVARGARPDLDQCRRP